MHLANFLHFFFNFDGSERVDKRLGTKFFFVVSICWCFCDTHKTLDWDFLLVTYVSVGSLMTTFDGCFEIKPVPKLM